MDISGELSLLQEKAREFGAEKSLKRVMCAKSNEAFLAAVADQAINPNFTDFYFVCLERLFVEICVRWMDPERANRLLIRKFSSWEVLAALGRVVPFAPHLVSFAEKYVVWVRDQYSKDFAIEFEVLSKLDTSGFNHDDRDSRRRELLLGVLRLMVLFENDTLRPHLEPKLLLSLLKSDCNAIRYLAFRLLSHHHYMADNAMNEAIAHCVGKGPVIGPWEGKQIDYTFFTLWEESRHKKLRAHLADARARRPGLEILSTHRRLLQPQNLSNHSPIINGIMLPANVGSETRRMTTTVEASTFAPTATTKHNLTKVAEGILSCRPLLLVGPSGCGKSSFTKYFCDQLADGSPLVSLHLNTQTDAKSLIGAYISGAKLGTVVWQSGILATAAETGQWVCIEDIDQAPQEVLSILLPLMERRQLPIPGRDIPIGALPAFKLIATLRAEDPASAISSWRSKTLGARLWHEISIEPLPTSEMVDVISSQWAPLKAFAPTLVQVYVAVRNSLKSSNFGQAQSRVINFRDLEKWCSRIHGVVDNNVSRDATDDIFLNAIDCFAGHLPRGVVEDIIGPIIAKELSIDPQRLSVLLNRTQLRIDVRNANTVRVGRVSIQSSQASKATIQKKRLPFAQNAHTVHLMERIAAATAHREPVLLVGETGIGKTYSIQNLANVLGRTLQIFNMSQQSQIEDLVGSMRPISMRAKIIPLNDEFEVLFGDTFSETESQQFLDMLRKYISKTKWKKVLTLWKSALEKVRKLKSKVVYTEPGTEEQDEERPAKRRKTGRSSPNVKANHLYEGWRQFEANIKELEPLVEEEIGPMTFQFVAGKLVDAVKTGNWVLLDEINLAPPATLEAIADLLPSGPNAQPFLTSAEPGSFERVEAHPGFRIFAAMNPSTDVGKSDLPVGIRSRFTELYVDSPDGDETSLRSIVRCYDTATHQLPVDKVVKLYLEIQRHVKQGTLTDVDNRSPHFSLRNLTRALTYGGDTPSHRPERMLYEGFCMAFTTMLNHTSRGIVEEKIQQHILGPKASIPLNEPRIASKTPSVAYNYGNYVEVQNYWLRGQPSKAEQDQNYILTTSVRRNLINLARAASAQKYPILLQGPTSSGKTSLIRYLAKLTGNKFVRINNHEHTDLQEYTGSYVSAPDGALEFRDGALVQALRRGEWIVLDELNLAPTEVLEALNRLLDDNRELRIPETQEVVRPHRNFMLFATQNPAGSYGGRKELSRAFRNRFLELHFDDVPIDELEDILKAQKQIPPTWCENIAKVYQKLSERRQADRLFEQHSFATLRDVFRWVRRIKTAHAETSKEVALHGFMLLGERVRDSEQRQRVREIIEGSMTPPVNIDDSYFQLMMDRPEYTAVRESTDYVWTEPMMRVVILVGEALRNNEPVLLVGQTGTGKTSVCQKLAAAMGKRLFTLNAHQNTDTGDIIGSLRPNPGRKNAERALRSEIIRLLQTINHNTKIPNRFEDLWSEYNRSVRDNNKIERRVRESVKAQYQDLRRLFFWKDGPLVEAMRKGQYFLLDEISIAEDAVVERLNSVLEESRSLFLAEKTPGEEVFAAVGYQFLATMNPGGDYGKKELSRALRNRFTEIWVPPIDRACDVVEIIERKIRPEAADKARAMVDFALWFQQACNMSPSPSISIRDIEAWIQFINTMPKDALDDAFVHGALSVYVDTLYMRSALKFPKSNGQIQQDRDACLKRLSEIIGRNAWKHGGQYHLADDVRMEIVTDNKIRVGPFELPGTPPFAQSSSKFSFDAPTTRSNLLKLVRALQIDKPILIEGRPGVGKTALVMALAHQLGRRIHRINLSEQTDLTDLFGSHLPVEGEATGVFDWRPGPFLTAMTNGDWVLLDEMNLASQSVLEGLNACLDHRATATIPELGKSFARHPHFRVFATQNPSHDGGDRKGLPASFVNRFSLIYAEEYTSDDLIRISSLDYPDTPESLVRAIIKLMGFLNSTLFRTETMGSPGVSSEFNLRDIQMWLHLNTSSEGLLTKACPYDLFDVVIRQRFRTSAELNLADKAFSEAFRNEPTPRSFYHWLTSEHCTVGLARLPRDPFTAHIRPPTAPVDISHLNILESMMLGVQEKIPVLLVGESGAGKSTLIRALAAISGADLAIFHLSADVDASDLVGSFEHIDPMSALREFQLQFFKAADELVSRALCTDHPLTIGILNRLATVRKAMPWHIIDEIKALLNWVQGCGIITPKLAELQDQVGALRKPGSLEKPRFVWLDSILVKALLRGQWIVLDNANLCKPAVLDRLNSLLEPDGELVINELPQEDGRPRRIKPHDNFRLFLTMDPMHGELSKAMHNRVLELYVPQTGRRDLYTPFWTESLTHSLRYHTMDYPGIGNGNPELEHIISDHIGIKKIQVLEQFTEQLRAGILATTNADRVKKAIRSVQRITNRLNLLKQMGAVNLGTTASKMLHPLNNEISIRGASDALKAHVLASLYEIMMQLLKMEDAFERVFRGANQGHLPNALTQSTAVPWQSTAERDDSHIAGFLLAFKDATKDSLDSLVLQHNLRPTIFNYLDRAVVFWWSVYRLAQSGIFDDSIKQAVVELGRSDLQRKAKSKDLKNLSIPKRHLELIDEFASPVRRSGKAMEQLWQRVRPQTVPTEDRLDLLLQMEKLADRFDEICFANRVPLSQLCLIREAFGKAVTVVITGDVDPTGLLFELEGSLEPLKLPDDSITVQPFFTEQFGQLWGILHIWNLARFDHGSSLHDLRQRSALLARRATKWDSQVCIDHADQNAQSLITILASSGSDVEGAFSDPRNALISSKIRLNMIDEVPLSASDLLHDEIRILGQTLSLAAPAICGDITGRMLSILKTIWEDVKSAVSLDFGPHGKSQIFSELITNLESGISKAAIDQPFDKEHTASEAYISFGLLMTLLYVPDRLFDPAVKPTMARTLWRWEHEDLEEKLGALVAFERVFSGQSTSLRIRGVQAKISALGKEPTVAAICRPQVSQLASVQGEFDNVLRAVRPLLKKDGSTDLEVVRRNLQQVMQRLRNNFRAYDDITIPLVGFLQCLIMGIELRDLTEKVTGDESGLLDRLLHIRDLGLAGILSDCPSASQYLEMLRELSIAHSVDPYMPLNDFADVAFSSLYETWRDTVTKEQEQNVRKSSLFVYRGFQEDEESADNEEFTELFPTFEADPGAKEKVDYASVSRETAVCVADVHAAIYCSTTGLSETILDLMRTQTVDLLRAREAAVTMLPKLLLSLHSSIQSTLASSTSSRLYNFYKDSNVEEGEKLSTLVRQIHHRFVKLRKQWPEHDTLAEVIRMCDEINSLSHCEPVAKFLSRSEKLHNTIYEWQKVASRDYSAADLFDEVTKLIISWRRLELSTWLRLFDIETEQCVNDAKSWWFVAYENIIAVPMSLLATEQSLDHHSGELLRTLETFMISTTIGQFHQRLVLLSQFIDQLQQKSKQTPPLKRLHSALFNFVRYYEKFSGPVKEALTHGRQRLEQDVKEVVQLASWKDTTIEALRQSAKMSHRKLFKIVRKFRQLLHTPVTSIIGNGIPESPYDRLAVLPPSPPLTPYPPPATADLQALALKECEQGVNDWNHIPSRFRNVDSTTVLMSKLCEGSESLDAHHCINEFVSNFTESMSRLRKGTPSGLEEHNKDLVKHLKIQKRKLFADTLRALRQMGIQHNLSQILLGMQNSLSLILATTSAFAVAELDTSLQSAEYGFHRMLVVMPNVRQLSREHSGDLTPAEVSRSVGYLEGLLYRQLKQRESLHLYLVEYRSLEKATTRLNELWHLAQCGLSRRSPEGFTEFDSFRRTAIWLPPVLKVFQQVLHAQSSMGGIEASGVLEGLRQNIDKFENLIDSMRTVPTLPLPLATDSHDSVRIHCRDSLRNLRSDMNTWCQQVPQFAPVLSQLESWADPAKNNVDDVFESTEDSHTLEDFQKRLFHTVDILLASIQEVSKQRTRLPSSTEDISWLIKCENCLSTMLRCFSISTLSTLMNEINQVLARIPSKSLRTAAALTSVLAPIFQQYQILVKDAIDKYSSLHDATTRLSYRLAKAFLHLGKDGFCMPPETVNKRGEQGEKLEGGVGLDGEGAEDISKHVGLDEDLTDLAEDSENAERKDKIEDEQDAVDMADAEMEGQIGEMSDRSEDDDAKSTASGDEQDEIDEEIGDVDDLGPGAVDEKMWDDGGRAGKDKEGDRGKGTKQDEKAAAQPNGERGEDDGEVVEAEAEVGAEEDGEISRQPLEEADPHMQEGENLDLPEDMELEGKDHDNSSDVLDDLHDLDENDTIDMERNHDIDDDDIASEGVPENMESEGGENDVRSDDGDEQSPDAKIEREDVDSDAPKQDEDGMLAARSEEGNAAESAVQSGKAGGLSATEPQEGQEHDQLTAVSAQQKQSDVEESRNSASEGDGKSGSHTDARQNAAGRDDELQDSAEAQAFKKLGDTLERWYKQHRQIQQAKDGTTSDQQPPRQDDKLKDVDFEHLPDDESRADAQALGAARQDQAIAFDSENAIDVNDQESSEDHLANGDQVEQDKGDVEMADVEMNHIAGRQAEADGVSRTFIGEQRSLQDHERFEGRQYADSESDIEGVDERLSTVHLQSPANLDQSRATARTLWYKHASSTAPFSAILTEQLRLILAPTLATRLRGDFRTGKRLNMKRIIPYIASDYKKDKIWMRRTVPTKRYYQLMIALDDSKSMAEGGSNELAFETLALISKALAMLEAGELCIVSFGEGVKVQHAFDRPFTDEAGVGVFAGFQFNQHKTDVRKLVNKGIELFTEARMKAGSSTAELWQLMLIVSDGVCEDHEGIARLVRKAQEQRIMIVFVVVDAGANVASADGKKEQSIMDLQTAEFTKDEKGHMQLVRKRYMDTFPFRWWLVVRDVRELPGVLATALRQWFAEVADA